MKPIFVPPLMLLICLTLFCFEEHQREVQMMRHINALMDKQNSIIDLLNKKNDEFNNLNRILATAFQETFKHNKNADKTFINSARNAVDNASTQLILLEQIQADPLPSDTKTMALWLNRNKKKAYQARLAYMKKVKELIVPWMEAAREVVNSLDELDKGKTVDM